MTMIVAEAGIAHGGDFDRAVELAEQSKAAGADIVKFQMFYGFPQLKKFEFRLKQWEKLFSVLNGKGIRWFCTAFDFASVQFLSEFEMDTWKIPSNPSVVHDRFLLKLIAGVESNKHTIISTGISDDDDIKRLLKIFRNNNVTLLHCVSKYPTPIAEADLERIDHLKMFGVPVGYSDHTVGTIAPCVAVKEHGATIIEKHLTLSYDGGMPDDCVSLEPEDFEAMVHAIRRVQCAANVA